MSARWSLINKGKRRSTIFSEKGRENTTSPYLALIARLRACEIGYLLQHVRPIQYLIEATFGTKEGRKDTQHTGSEPTVETSTHKELTLVQVT